YTEVMIPGGRSALVKSSEVTPLEQWQQQTQFDPKHLVDFAYNFNGQPYLWGGNSLKGVDCSGFTGAVYYSMGIFLPRDASQQVKQGDDVAYDVEEVEIDGKSYSKMIADNLEVGDLLFFGNKERGRVTHVGIWIGNDEFIHSSGRVHVTSVDPAQERYEVNYVERLMGVKRINGSSNLDKTQDLTTTNIWF
ncbi:MAG: C40 family peptidase, partial [Bacteroidota bacterium]